MNELSGSSTFRIAGSATTRPRRRPVLAGILFGLALAIGCSHEATPVVAPDEHPPLPEATPIGYLIDDASELHLRDDQLGQLRDLDSALAQRLDAIDADQRGPAPAARPPGQSGGRRGGGRHGGGGRRGGGGAGGGGAGGGGDASSPAAIANAGPATLPTDGSGSASPPPPAVKSDRAGDIKAALVRAFAVLDPDQQPAARKVLADHGIDLDHPTSSATTGHPGSPSAPSAGSAAP